MSNLRHQTMKVRIMKKPIKPFLEFPLFLSFKLHLRYLTKKNVYDCQIYVFSTKLYQVKNIWLLRLMVLVMYLNVYVKYRRDVPFQKYFIES